MKRLLGILLVLAMFLSLLSGMALGAEIVEDGATVEASEKEDTRAPKNKDIFLSTVDGWPGYEEIFTTPAFSGRGDDFTDNGQMVSYLKSLLPTCGNMYYFTLGYSPTYKLETPLVVFTKTDLTGMSMEEAAVAVRGNGKATVLHQAQIHGNEPAAGEGSLALAGALARGDLKDYNGKDILDTLNIMIIPRINPDGSYKFQRNNTANGINLNRDYLVVKSTEVELVLNAYNAFLPEVVIDAHEWTPDKTSGTGFFDDLQLWAAGSLNNTSSMLDRSITMMETVFDAAEEQGIRPYYYQGIITFGAGSNSIGPWYFGLRGSLGFCVETRGIGIGWSHFERRVISQYFASESFIQYTAAHADEIISAVKQERSRIAEVGAEYDESDQLVLQHKSRSYDKTYIRPTVSTSSNSVVNPNATARPTIYDVAGRTRSRPTAYLLRSGTSNLQTVLKTLDKHNIRYIKLEESLSLTVQKYSGSGSSASLSSEQSVTFPAGSYVFPMDQEGGNVLAMLMEPDVSDTASSSDVLSTFVQKKTLSASSIYRFTGSLDVFAESFEVSFRQEDGTVLQTATVKKGESAVYSGETPTKSYTEDVHYTFTGWVKEDGSPADLSNITADRVFYASFQSSAHSYDSKVETEAGCTAEGLRLYSCTECGRSYTESIEILPHTTELRNVKAPLCNAPGYTGDLICIHCNTVVQKGEVLPVLDHSPTLIAGKEATCTASGLSDGEICEACGLTLRAQEVLPRLGHSYGYEDLGDGSHLRKCIRCEKSNTESHSYENGLCVCGLTVVTEDSALKLNHSLNLASDISVNYAVAKELLEGYDVNSLTLECTLPRFDGNFLIGESTVRIAPVEQGKYYYFTLEGLTAVNMNDSIQAVLYATKDGQRYCSPVDSYSIASYAYSQLNKAEASRSLKTLCADLLRYGSAAQIHKEYRTTALADSNMTELHRSYLSDLSLVTFGSTNEVLEDMDNAPIVWAGKALDLNSKVSLKFIFSLGEYTGAVEELQLKVEYKDLAGDDQTAWVTGAESYGEISGRYAFTFDGLLAAQLRTMVAVAVYAGESRISQTLRYSADTYGNNKTGTLAELCKALYAYSDSALDYFKN